MTHIQRAGEELRRIRVFVELAHHGFHTAAHGTKALDWLEKYGHLGGQEKSQDTPEVRIAQRAHAQELESFANEQISAGLPYLFGLAVIRLWTVLEVLVEDITIERLKDPTSWKKAEVINSIKGSVVEFSNLDKDEQANYLGAELRRAVGAGQKLGVGEFEGVLEVVGCGGGVPETVRKILLELQQIRHVIVHRAGTVDRRILRLCPWITTKVGDLVVLRRNHFDAYYEAAYWYTVELAERDASPQQIEERREYFREGRMFQGKIIENLNTKLDVRWQSI